MSHPILQCAKEIAAALRGVEGVPAAWMEIEDKRAALRLLTVLGSRVEAVRHALLANSDDVAHDEGARDIASWLAVDQRLDRHEVARAARLADAVEHRWPEVRDGFADGRVNRAQAAVIATALDDLPDDVPDFVRRKAESHLVAEAATFGPRELRALGRRILDIVAPELGEQHEREALEREEREARRHTLLTSRRRGDGTTDIHIRVSDAVADRLMTTLSAFTSTRRESEERISHPQALGHAFVALLEGLDPDRLPLHGGDATSVMVTIDLAALRDSLSTAITDGGTLITASEARRLACTAKIIPLVLGGDSTPLDLGRGRRLFSPGQRKAMAVRDRTCRASGCDIPAAWCEAHHAADPWSRGGKTDLADGVLLCSWHHHRAHDDAYLHTRLPNGDLRFHRRR
jgi:hypothetical protein